MKKITRVCAGMLVALVFANGAFASTVTWTLENVTFQDSGTAIGSFDFDADSNIYSNINISTTSGSSFGGTSYTAYSVGSQSQLFLGNGSYDLFLGFTPLTNAGGTSSITGFGEQVFGGAPLRPITGGSLTASVVPIPAAAWLFGSALGVLGWIRRKAN